MSRQLTSTRRIGAPSQRARTTLSLAGPYAMTLWPRTAAGTAAGAAALSGCGGTIAVESAGVPACGSATAACSRAAPCASRTGPGGPDATSARAETSTLALSTSVSPGDASTPGTDPVACQLGLPALREALHQVLERLLRVGTMAEPLLAQAELVERGGRPVPRGPALVHAGVLDPRAVELRLGEEALPRPVLRVVREVGVGEAAQELAVAHERQRVAPLREIRRGLIVEHRRVRARGRGGRARRVARARRRRARRGWRRRRAWLALGR